METIPTYATICVLPLAGYNRGQRDQHKKVSSAGGGRRTADTCKLHNGRNRGHKSSANGDLNFDTGRNGHGGTDCSGRANGHDRANAYNSPGRAKSHYRANACNSSGNTDANAGFPGSTGTRRQRGNR